MKLYIFRSKMQCILEQVQLGAGGVKAGKLGQVIWHLHFTGKFTEGKKSGGNLQKKNKYFHIQILSEFEQLRFSYWGAVKNIFQQLISSFKLYSPSPCFWRFFLEQMTKGSSCDETRPGRIFPGEQTPLSIRCHHAPGWHLETSTPPGLKQALTHIFKSIKLHPLLSFLATRSSKFKYLFCLWKQKQVWQNDQLFSHNIWCHWDSCVTIEKNCKQNWELEKCAETEEMFWRIVTSCKQCDSVTGVTASS